MKELVNDGFAKVVKPYIDAQDKKSREIIAPVEVSPAEATHSIGDQIIFDGILYDVIAPIAVDDPLTATGAGANIELADDISAQIKAQKEEIQTVRAQAAANNKSTQEMIAPVEEDETDASRAYEIGEQLILDGILYDVIDDIAQHGIITAEGAGANIEVADTIAEQIKNKTITTDAVPTHGSTNPVQSGGTFDAILDEAKTRGELGAKNLTPYPYYNESPHSTNGITFTTNADGSVTAAGTATSDAYFRCTYTTGDKHIALKAGVDYILSGTGNSNVAVLLRNSGGSNVASGRASDVKYSCTTAGDYDIILAVDNGTDLTTPITIYPMLRLATDADSTYQPYAKTNRELTAENQTLTNYANAQSNPNLLDNPFFTVNQRGEDSYSASTSYTYTFDRWLLYNATLSKITKGVRYTAVNNSLCVLRQFIENVDYLDGEKVTLSAIINNELRVLSGTFLKNDTNLSQTFVLDNGSFALQLIMGSNDTYARVVLASYTTENLDIKAFKLELGEVSTLAIDTAPNYATELLKCQRYFVRFKGNPIFYGFCFDTESIRLFIPIGMRVKPSVVYTVGSSYPQLMANGTLTRLSNSNSFSVSSGTETQVLLAIAGFSNLSANELCAVKFNTGALDFSADL